MSRGQHRYHPSGKATRRLDPDTGMNKTEAAYARKLETQREQGSILRFDFEPETLRLANRTSYTPDFRVILPDGTVEFHEVKGGYVREDAWVKFKMAAELHPYVFLLCQCIGKPDKGVWTIKEAANLEAA